MFRFRTYREMDYLEALNGRSRSTVDDWSGMELATHDGWVCRKVQLPVGIRNILNSGAFLEWG